MPSKDRRPELSGHVVASVVEGVFKSLPQLDFFRELQDCVDNLQLEALFPVSEAVAYSDSWLLL